MKANRLLSELMLLQARGRISTRELAERMEISQRTAHRDMEALCAAGVPLVALRGSQGGWELDGDWKTQAPGFDEAELTAFMLAQPTSVSGPGMAAAAERALNKILAAMPKGLRNQAANLRARIHVDPEGWGPWSEDFSALPVVQEAVANELRLRFDYRTRDQRAGVRTVDPLGVVCKQNGWYLVAKVESGMRTYRISRMSQVVVLDQRFERPPNFDLAAYWKKSAAEFAGQRKPLKALLGLELGAAKEFAQWGSLRAAEGKANDVELPAGWGAYQVSFESIGQAVFCVLGLGSRVIALEPAMLRERVQDEWRKRLDWPFS